MVDDREPVKDAPRRVRRVSPVEAKSLLDQGYLYVDVRSVPEFDDLHPTGARNVPLAAQVSQGTAGGEFLAVMARLFSRDAKIVVGCATGVRSLRAAELLGAAGFTDVIDQRAGMDGARGPFGNLVEPGWVEVGLPVTGGPDAGSLAALASQRPASER